VVFDLERSSTEYSAAIESGSFDAARGVVHEALGAGVNGAEIFTGMITPAMYRIGERWERAEITAADEHLATGITNRIIGEVYGALAVEMPSSRERVVVAAVQGDQHVMGLRMVADVLEGAGFETLYLGANTSLEGLVECVLKHRPSVVAIGGTAPWSGTGLVEAIKAIRSAAPTLPIVLGGAQATRAAAAAAAENIFVVDDATRVVEVVETALGPRSVGDAA
jgi:methanogenic corrinoid protein MtbC1